MVEKGKSILEQSLTFRLSVRIPRQPHYRWYMTSAVSSFGLVVSRQTVQVDVVRNMDLRDSPESVAIRAGGYYDRRVALYILQATLWTDRITSTMATDSRRSSHPLLLDVHGTAHALGVRTCCRKIPPSRAVYPSGSLITTADSEQVSRYLVVVGRFGRVRKRQQLHMMIEF